MATSYYEEDSTGMPRLVKAPAPAPAPAGIINQAVAPSGFAGVQGVATAPAPSVPAAAPPVPRVRKPTPQDPNVFVSSGQGVTFTGGVGKPVTPDPVNPAHTDWSKGGISDGVLGMMGYKPDQYAEARKSIENSQQTYSKDGFGGVQNDPANAALQQGLRDRVATGAPAGPPTPGPSGNPNTRPFVPDGAGSSSSASGTSGFREWNVTAPQTVQSQANNIIAADSPLMQQARGRAMQQMNERGLINSSMAVQASQDAVMDRALQIAAPDAATNAQAAQFNANQGNAWNLAQQEMAQRDKQFAQDMEYKRWALSQNFENEKQLREVESKYRTELESDSGFQRQYSAYIDRMHQIDMNPDLELDAKLEMKKQAGQQLDDYVTINKLGINMDFSDYWAAKMAPPKEEEKPRADVRTGGTFVGGDNGDNGGPGGD